MATIEIDGKKIDVPNGKMIIEVADEAGIYIPRFCYHKKLSVAANCRMCLVEVENGRKPVPACATPITDGMRVYTKSEEAVRSQKAVMEFLLINHPLDCPICDQGGECELQDISMGFGQDTSEYTDSKRAVEDDPLGSLISTEMTRCIHCTRCVRFGDEIAGLRELGATGRGENMQIGTYVQHSITSEISGNIIDLCPVGALTSKPYRFTARAWEMTQSDSIAPHDCLGSNVHAHVRRNQLMRVVPKENESLNETWLSDRDRFSYLGMKSEKRLLSPMIRKNGVLEAVEWEEALSHAASGITRVIKKHGAEQFAAFSTASATLEEAYLLQKWMRSMGVENLDHRLHQQDFSDQAVHAVMPSSELSYQDLELQKHIVIIGCNVVREVPLAGVRIRKAIQSGALISSINPIDYSNQFKITHAHTVSPFELPFELARILVAICPDVTVLPDSLQALLLGIETNAKAKTIAQELQKGDSVLLTGAILDNHPNAALLRTFLFFISKYSGAKQLHFTSGANSAGMALAGMLPHRTVAGKSVSQPGKTVQESIASKMKGYLLHGVDASFDFNNPQAVRQSMLAAEFVVVVSAFADASTLEYADVVLPMAPYTETSGTYINVNGNWQSFKGAMTPLGEARPAWKIYRVLANLTQADGFEYMSSDDVLSEVKSLYSMAAGIEKTFISPTQMPDHAASFCRIGEWSMYRIDAITRHSEALQKSAAADKPCVRVHPKTANRLKLEEQATIAQGDIEITLPLKRDDTVALDCICVACGLPETADLGSAFAPITIKR